MDTQQIKEGATEIVTSLKSTPITTNFLVAGVVLLVLLVGGYFFATGYADYKTAIAVAEIKEKEAKEKEKMVLAARVLNDKMFATLTEEAQKREALIGQLTAQQGEIRRAREQRAIEDKRKIEEVSAPARPAPDVVKDVATHLDITAMAEAAGILFTKEDTQKLVAQGIAKARLEGELVALQQELGLEREKVVQLTGLLTETRLVLQDSKELLDDYKIVMDDYKVALESYKKAAKKSKWQKVKSFGIRAAEIAVTAVIVSAAAN